MPSAPPATNRASSAGLDFDLSPFLVVWETTRACDLACLHCRASAQPLREPRELTTMQAMLLMNQVRSFGRPLFVLTGGDPAKRPDLVGLVEHGARVGLRMGLAPSGTPLMTPETIRRLSDAGLSRLAVGLDGSCAGVHDRVRGVPGSFDATLRMLRAAEDCRLSVQVDTTLSRRNVDDLEAISTLLAGTRITLWSVSFLLPTRGVPAEDAVGAEEFERVFNRLNDLSKVMRFAIESTAAPQYRRVVLQRQVAERRRGERTEAPERPAGSAVPGHGAPGRDRSVNDGSGCLFVSHTGEIYPSALLPLSAGNVRTHEVVDVYRNHHVFRTLRDPDRLKGKCGVCEYREACGGSRARAYALTGDPLEADPLCGHLPARYLRMVERGEAEPVDAYFARRVRGLSPPPSEPGFVSLREFMYLNPIRPPPAGPEG